jgi:hypothetical protein
MMVAEMMKNNTTITSLCLADAGASRFAMIVGPKKHQFILKFD